MVKLGGEYEVWYRGGGSWIIGLVRRLDTVYRRVQVMYLIWILYSERQSAETCSAL
jgi:hypothetical protein